jgi:hypothetical protein
MWDAAAALGVPDQVIRKLIQCGLLPAKQVMPDAPWQIRVEDASYEPAWRAQASPQREEADNNPKR